MPRKDEIVIYHNPRCAKSRAALQLLRGRGIEPRIVEYLKQPPAANELLALLRALKRPPHDLLRTKEAEYKKLRLLPESSETSILRAIAQHPILFERPIVVRGNRAVIARPPEKAADLI
jgi:arsenate reductase